MRIIFSESAKIDWQKLDQVVRARLRKKLIFYLKTDPLQFAEPIKDKELGEYRFRVGDYRIIFDLKNDTLFILRVGHRRDIYR